MSNLGVIVSAWAIAIFLLWIPLEGKEMFHKHLFWNLWFVIYFVFTCIRLHVSIKRIDRMSMRGFITIMYLLIIVFLTMHIWLGSLMEFSFGKIFFLIAIPFDLFGRFI